MHGGDHDESLMAQTALGDQRAFRLLMVRHMERSIRLAQALLGTSTDADEIAQEAFIRVWRGRASFDPTIARFTTWFYRIVVNLAIDRSRQPRGDPIESADEIAADEPGPLARLIAREEECAAAQCIAQLPARQRTAIALFHFEGLSMRDAAETMGVSDKAFESLLVRARATLKQRVMDAQVRSRRRS